MTYLSLERAAVESWAALEEQQLSFGKLRFSDGYRKRSNSVVLLDLQSTPFDEIVELCCDFYRRRLPSVLIRIPSFGTSARFDAYLQNAGFSSIARARVLTCALGMGHETELPGTGINKDDWIDRYYRVCPELFVYRQIHSQLLDRVPGKILFASLETEDGDTACCALGILHRHLLSIYNVATAVRFRRHYYASRLIRQILAWGRQQRASDALLQVEESNAAALQLYATLGFRTSHWYWYRQRSL